MIGDTRYHGGHRGADIGGRGNWTRERGFVSAELAVDSEATPTVLYKYRGMAGDALDFTRRLIVDSELYFAAPTTFNDPFDFLPVMRISRNPAEQRQAIAKMLPQRLGRMSRPERRRETQRLLALGHGELSRRLSLVMPALGATIGVCCFSARPDHVLMWSHYGDQHRGICLGFDASPPLTLFSMARQVRYSEHRPVIEEPNRGKNDLHHALVTKAAFWSYEQEWRILQPSGPGTYGFDPGRLKQIILGARISDGDRQRVRGWIEGRSIEILEAVPDGEDFGLNLRQEGEGRPLSRSPWRVSAYPFSRG